MSPSLECGGSTPLWFWKTHSGKCSVRFGKRELQHSNVTIQSGVKPPHSKGEAMRKALLLVWLMLPVLVGAYHYGPGQRQLLLDDVAAVIAQAEKHAAAEQWDQAVAKYEEALNLLPGDQNAVARRVRLERAKAQMFVKQLPEAHEGLKALVAELTDDQTADPKLLAEARATLANSQYYMTWLMRLEGQSNEKWEPEIEAARQTFRLLAEQSESTGDTAACQRHSEDLEAAIRLERMALTDLQGLPLPSQ